MTTLAPLPPTKDTNAPVPVSIITYKTPKYILLTIIKIGMAKGEMGCLHIAVMGFLAGAFVGFGAMFMLYVAAGMGTEPGSLGALSPGLAKLISASLFPGGLSLIVITGGELFTGSVMYMSAAVIARKTTLAKAVKVLTMTYLGNFAGAVAQAYFLTYLTETFSDELHRNYVIGIAEKKCHMGWGVVFLKGVGANWLVCLALMLMISSDTLEGKIIGMWWPITVLATMGFEHSIANMFTVDLGLMLGADLTFGRFVAWNLIPSTLGNFFAGTILIACIYSWVYSEHIDHAIKFMSLFQGKHRVGKSLEEPMSNSTTFSGESGKHVSSI